MKELKELKVIVKNVFGTTRVYPQCTEGKLLAFLSGQKSFTKLQVETLKELGYELVQDVVKL